MVERWVAGGATRMLPVAGLLVAAWLLGPGGVQAQSIATLAGGPVGDGAAATSASLNNPQGVAVDASGNLLVADVGNHRIRRIAAGTGIITTVAGNGTSGFGGDGGPATNANLSLPRDVAVDASGNLFVVDQGNQRIRRIAAGTGIITTVAGNGTAGFGGDGGLATAASLHNPRGIAVDASGNLVVADTDNHRLRRIAAGTGIITTLAGTGTAGFLGDGGAATNASLNKPVAVAFDASGNLSVADSLNQRIRRIAAGTGIITTVAGNGSAAYGGDGGAATSASLNFPRGLRFDASGNLFVADTENARIRKIAAGTGIITTTAGTGTAGFSGDGGAATSANLRRPTGLAVDAGGNLLLADFDNRRLRRVAAGTGIITTVGGGGTFAGDGGVASSAVMSSPQGLAIDPSQNVYLADQGNQRIRKIAAGTGIITTVAGTGASGFGGDGGAATGASLANPEGLAVDASGHLFIADTVNHRIRRIAAGTGIITTVAGNGTFGFGGDGGAATSANLYYPTGVALDASGNLFVADWGNQRIRKIAAGTGIITTVAGNGSTGFSGDGGAATGASLNFPRNLTVDASGNVVLADTGNHRLRRIAAGTGIITTVAGNGTAGFNGDGIAATSASLNNPIGLAVDAAGNLLVADTLNQRIRKIATGTGIITTAAGNGTLGFSGDGGIATSASLYNPFSLAFDTNGNFNFPDLGNDRIRQVSPPAAQRSFVASYGNDTNLCDAFAPCRSLAQALAHTAPGGEVVVLDSADYGAVTIAQSVSVVAATGIYAGVSGLPGGNAITIAAGPSDSIVLRGLSIGSAGGNHGILFTSGAALYVENTVVRGFTPPGLANVAFQPVGPAKLFVKDSRIQSGAIGLKVVSAGDPVGVVVDNTRFEGNGTGVLVAAEGELALRNVVVASGTADGINLAAANGQPLTVAVDRALVTDNAGAGLTVGGVNQVAVTVKGSTLRGNGSYGVYVQGGGTPSVVRLDRNVIMHNATGVATGPGGTILSRGNNTIEGNGSNGSVTGTYTGQ